VFAEPLKNPLFSHYALSHAPFGNYASATLMNITAVVSDTVETTTEHKKEVLKSKLKNPSIKLKSVNQNGQFKNWHLAPKVNKIKQT